MNSILLSIKKLLGIDANCEHFDQDVLIHINSALSNLTQLGVGPPDGFIVTSNSETWSDLLMDSKKQEFVKSYIYLKVRLIFDPPSSSSVIDAINRQIQELEWRIEVNTSSTPTADISK